MRLQAEQRPKYQPLDELLDMLPVRILRVLARFDIVTADELGVALELVGIARDHDTAGWSTHQTIGRLVKRGLIGRRGPKGRRFYWITADGRRELASVVVRAQPERELGALSDEEAETGVPAWKVAMRKRLARSNRVNRWRAGRRLAV